MLKNYLLTALRTFRKERFYMIINVGGLMLSFFSCLVLCLYIRDEFSYDDFHEHKDHIYRIFEENSGRQFAVTPYPWAESLVEEFSEIEDIARVLPISAIFQVGDQLFSEPRGIVADTSFFNVFSFPLVSGDAATALTSPNTVLITPALAEKYFGTIEVLDQMIEINLFGDAESFAVAGVIEPPAQSQLQFDFVLPYERVIANNPNPHAFENWSVHFLYSYVLANQPLDPADMKVRLKEFLDRHHGDWLSAKYNPQVEPLSSIYLHSNKEFELPVRGSFTDLLILAAVALSILVIGLINYINLTTARAFSRLRGASVRRVYGATKWHITQQHLVESSLLVGLSMLLAALSVQVLHQPLSEISGKDFSNFAWVDEPTLAALVGAWAVLSLIAGCYPGLLISSFQPSMVTRNKMQSAWQILARKVLVAVQIGASVLLITATLVMWRQVQFMGQAPLGYEKEQLVILNDAGLISSDPVKFRSLRNRLEDKPFFLEMSSLSSYPGTSSHWSSRYFLEGDTEATSMSIVTFFTDFNFVETMGLTMASGRDFEQGRAQDSVNFIINEACLKLFAEKDPGWAEDPFGQTLDWRFAGQKGRVVGIVKDFHFESLKSEIKPAIITEYLPFTGFTAIKVAAEDYQVVMEEIETAWQALFPRIPFAYSFANDTFQQTFQSELKLGRLFVIFAGLSLFIGMLGLLGLSASFAHEKSQEIGIRKVIGASKLDIVRLMLRQFATIVVLANLVALPLAYVLTSHWLRDFTYRISWPVETLFYAFGVTLLVALATVLIHTLRMAALDPVRVLRST